MKIALFCGLYYDGVYEPKQLYTHPHGKTGVPFMIVNLYCQDNYSGYRQHMGVGGSNPLVPTKFPLNQPVGCFYGSISQRGSYGGETGE